MADTINLSSMIPKVSTGDVLQWTLITITIILGLVLLGVITYKYIQKKKYGQYRIIIIEKDSTGNTHEYYDRAGIFTNKKTGLKLLFLEKMKKGLNPNNVPYVTSKDKKGRLIKTVYLVRTGVSNFKYCHIKVEDGILNFTVGEEDVNWAAQEIENIRRTFNKDSWLNKFAPYILFIVTILIVMIVLISLFNKMSVIKEASNNLVTISEKQLEITTLLYNITTSPTLNNNIPIIVPSVNSGG